jgi:CRP-like cAMP-binding protein
MNETNQEDFIISKETVKSTPLGKELSDEQCALLASVVTACSIRDGDFLIEEGLKDNAIHVLSRGRLEVLVQSGGGSLITLQILKEGDMVGEMGFIDDIEHSASLRALGNCELIRLERGDFEGLLQQDPDLVYKVMRAIIRTVHRILRGMNAQHVELTNYIAKQHGRY